MVMVVEEYVYICANLYGSVYYCRIVISKTLIYFWSSIVAYEHVVLSWQWLLSVCRVPLSQSTIVLCT